MSDINSDEFDLSALILHNSTTAPFFNSPSGSPAPEQEQQPQVEQRPISKRRGKKRSSRACTTCRQRKVRCNIIAHGAPCSNCRHDEIDCILPLSRRQRSAKERAEKSLRESQNGSEAGDRCHGGEELEEICQSVEQPVSITALAPHGMRLSDHPLAEILPTESTSSHEPVLQAPTTMRSRAWIQIQPPLSTAPIPMTSTKAPDQRLPILPKVFTPFPHHLEVADLMYLHTRDALTLPSESFQVALLKAYVNYVHGSMPILDLEEFLTAVKYGYEGLNEQRGKNAERELAGRAQINFLLFQAVMFAGAEFVELKALKAAGWTNREDCRRIMFGRVKLLYDFDTTADRLPIVQSLLFMTLYQSEPVKHQAHRAAPAKDASHYLNLAISLCYSLGLHRSLPLPAGTTSNMCSIRKRKLERRIFWTAFIRDRLVAISGNESWKQPVRIKKEDCEIPIIAMSDFDIMSDEDDEEHMRDITNAQTYIEKAWLCWTGSDTTFGSAALTAPSQPASTAGPTFEWQQLQHQAVPFQSPEVTSRPPVWQEEESLTQMTTTACSFPFIPPSSSQFHIAHPEFHDVDMLDEDVEYVNQAASSTTSSESPVPTPPAFEESTTFKAANETVINPMNAGYGVDGEYDDFLELLRPSIEVVTPKEAATPNVGKITVVGINRGIRERGTGGKMGRDRREGRSPWAFALEVDNDCAL
ncbi:Zn2/Cys6 DNA-binding protein [Glarea lozoyensis ATCC 20868]|uniref:Zn2/Cys6 DNA-binding protein n=1 Tax=Glarea lozoyensis (strain ATCC 20868 / MF5171) TaxID=1116229 RepID=S3CWR0_GLAL2|nr:Zn2/Cys6 DNA-binding protein [Glarea lozoyensis ATCC 20868]EPE24256.1 Zn2/Cys6 DNA-binding protein [Glarea lozoyensis ATCC 20868]